MFVMNDYYNINLFKLFNFLTDGIGYITGISQINQDLMNKYMEVTNNDFSSFQV